MFRYSLAEFQSLSVSIDLVTIQTYCKIIDYKTLSAARTRTAAGHLQQENHYATSRNFGN